MKPPLPCVLSFNAGSSSIRFAVHEAGTFLQRLEGKIDRIGRSGGTFVVRDADGTRTVRALSLSDPSSGLLPWLEAQAIFGSIKGAGHRVVHGLKHAVPARVTPRLLAELHRLIPLDPEHLPRELGLIEAVAARHPGLPQVACFDTAFHRPMPPVARRLAIPRQYAARGVERYGFHGLSYAYLMEELGRIDPAALNGCVILAHLGNGASLAAVHRGRSLDTSMGFTPAAGLMMGTRSGDLDPGLLSFLARRDGMTPAGFDRMVNHESGLLGVSGRSSDIRDLLAREDRDPRAAEAVELFCYQAKKWIGAYTAVLGGLDTVIFSAGIGQNAPVIRERICSGLGYLGLKLDVRRNRRNAAVISAAGSRVCVRVIRTDEELMIARSVVRMLHLPRRQRR